MINIHHFTFSPLAENTYILSNEKKEAIIIDPGCYFTAEEETLSGYIKDNGLKPLQLINTHCHPDHIFGNQFVYETYGLEAYIHPNEKQLMDMSQMTSQMFGLTINQYKGPVHFLTEKDKLEFDDKSFDIFLTPGHSPGSICFYCAEQKFVISGDVLFRESIGRWDFPGGSAEVLMNGIKTKLLPLPDDTVVYPGHGPQTTIGYERKNNPYILQSL